jgi:DNA-binding transcriptional ArsR family regulator
MNIQKQITTSVDFAKALADPTRHLAILREADLVEVRNEGKHSFYTLNQERMAYCCGQLISVFAPESETAIQLKDQILAN